MGKAAKKTVAGIELNKEKPTNVSLKKLHNWVIWQFPSTLNKGYMGAVRPAEAGHKWIPAVIQIDDKRVRIFGNADKYYSTPEQAARFFKDGG